MNDTPDDPRDPKLSRLYRKTSQSEPPPALDAAILAAARTAAAPQRPPRPWWRRLQAPFALTASVVLAVVLTLSMERNPPVEFDAPASAPGKERPAAEQKAPAGPDVGSAALSGTPAAIAPERKEAPRRAEVKQEMPTDARDNLAPPPSPAVSGAPASAAAKGLPDPAADLANESLAGSERRKSLAAPAAAPTPQASHESAVPLAQKHPETWLEEIRSLRRQGRSEEAERSLRDFRAAYPDYRLPEDLR
jgi:hypothetical protein